MIERASVVLPHPDSPASATICPPRASRSTPSTARATSSASSASPARGPARRTERAGHGSPGSASHLGRQLVDPVEDLTHASTPAVAGQRRLQQHARGAALLRRRPAAAGRPRTALERLGAPRVERAAAGHIAADRVDRRPGRSATARIARRRWSGTRRRGPWCTDAAGRGTRSRAGPSSTMRPAYITASRSLDLGQDREIVRDEQHRTARARPAAASAAAGPGLHHHVERGRGLVGDHQVRPARQRHRDHHALLLPPGELVREVLRAPRAASRPAPADRRREARLAPCPAEPCATIASTIWSPTRIDRIERVLRALEDDRPLGPADRTELGSAPSPARPAPFNVMRPCDPACLAAAAAASRARSSTSRNRTRRPDPAPGHGRSSDRQPRTAGTGPACVGVLDRAGRATSRTLIAGATSGSRSPRSRCRTS